MSEPDDRVAAGVAPQQQGPPRDALGRILPGHTANPHGRPKGQPNRTTKLAARRLLAHADRAATVLVAALDDPNPWVKLGAAKTILERADLVPEEQANPAHEWMTDREVETVARILARARRRRERGEAPRDRYADAFGPDSIPAPALPAAEAEDALIVPLVEAQEEEQ